MKGKVNKLAALVLEFDRFYNKEREKLTDPVLVEKFLARYPKLSANEKRKLREEIEFSLFLWHTLSSRPMPEDAKKRVWQRIEKKLAELKEKKEEEKITLPLTRRADFLILFLFALGKKIMGITRLMKYLFLLAKEKEISYYFKEFYSFTPHRLGPFDKNLYEDLNLLQKEGLIEKVGRKKVRLPAIEKEITDFFEPDNGFTEYRLTEKGIKLARGLRKGVDKKIIKGIQEIKSKYGKYPLLKLLEYIYENYPEYQNKSKVWQKIKRLKETT
ncbi:MAG: hypothetical protein ABIK81_04205 [candidate division WOR-3 bacterium]